MPSMIGRWGKGRRDWHAVQSRIYKAAVMAAESSTARVTLSSCRQMGRKGRPWVAAEVQCTRCERTVTRASGEEPEGELCSFARSRAAGAETARPAKVGAAGLAWAGTDVKTVAQHPPPVAYLRVA